MEKTTLQAGFARVDITPTIASVPLGGFSGTEFRLSGRILDPLFANVVALANGEERCLYVSMDILGIPARRVAEFREAVIAATGLPANRIFFTASHTHSGPELRSETRNAQRYRKEELMPKLALAARRALADLKPAKLSYGAMETGYPGKPGARLTFDRHYYCVETEKVGNYTEADKHVAYGEYFSNKEKYHLVEYMYGADHSLQVMRFTREGADDIILLNFASHGTFVGAGTKPDVSPDWPGAFVNRVEELFPGTKCAFVQGCAGNLIPRTRIVEEGLYGITLGVKMGDPHAYGSVLAGYAFQILTFHMQESETDELAFLQYAFPAQKDHSTDEIVPKAEKSLEVFRQKGHCPEAYAACKAEGFSDVWEALAILERSELPETDSLELNAIRIGDCAIATMPFEAWWITGLHIKEQSPFAMTFANAYCCGYQSYIPPLGTDVHCYEVKQMLYVPGTAEKIEEKLSSMLQKLKDNKS